MKRTLCLILALILALSMCVFVSADVIWEPEDDFFTWHSGDCTYVSAVYYANGENGYISVYAAPGDAKPRCVIPNGNAYGVSWTYNGEWALIEYDKLTLENAYGDETGWVRLTELAKKYDGADFQRDYADKMTAGEVTLSSEDVGESFVVWNYPGSGEVEYYSIPANDDLHFDSVYVDANGLRWGYIGYYYGRLNGWVCVDEPANAEIPAGSEKVELTLIPAAGEKELGGVETSSGSETVVVVCAVAVVIVAAGLIVMAIRKKKA